MHGVLLAVLCAVACGKSEQAPPAATESSNADPAATEPAPSHSRTLEDFIAISKKAREGKTLADLLPRVPVPERDRLKDMFASEPDAFLFLAGVTAIDGREAAELMDARARIMVANDLGSLDAAKAVVLSQWPGEQLYLDGLQSLDATTAIGLAGFKGKLLSLGELRGADPDAISELAKFEGVLAVSPGSESPPPAERSAEETQKLVQLVNAIAEGDAATVKAYLDAGGKPDFGENGNTLLMEAAYKKQPAVVEVLIKGGADVNAHSNAGETPLSFAAQWPMFDDRPVDPAVIHTIVRALVDAGARVDERVLEAAFEEADRSLGKEPAPNNLPALKSGWKTTLAYLAAKAGDTNPATYARDHEHTAVEGIFEGGKK